MSEKKVLEVIQIENFLKYIRKKRAWVCFICNGVDVHMVCKKRHMGLSKALNFLETKVMLSYGKNATK